MSINKKAADILWITCDAWPLQEWGDYTVGDTFFEVLVFSHIAMESSQSTTMSLKRVDINLYEGVGRIFDISTDNSPTLLFDCGIYAYRREATLPTGIESGSFVKMRFYLLFDEDYIHSYFINGEPILKVIPEMQYDWKIKDILVLADYDKDFENLPVAYESNTGDIYKRIKETNAYKDCGGRAEYILICEML
ncbi:MAG: hypothetical protein HQK99_02700 [Nitrospirae bacterium]|nr:hypothetical protein [Nitrospirota bacterium]